MRLSIATTGSFSPTCFDGGGPEETSRPRVHYKLLTGEQVEMIRASEDKEGWAKIWRSQVTALDCVTFEIDGVEKQVPVRDVPDIPGTYLLYFETAQHILKESILGLEAKKKLG